MPVDPKLDEYGTFKGDDIYAYTGSKDFIIDNILYEKDVVCISSLPGIGKSILALQLLSNLTTGEPFLGIYEIKKPQVVLYVQTEGDRAETIERLRNMQSTIKIDNSKWVHMNLASISLNTNRGIKDFFTEAHAMKLKFDVIIIDPLYTTVKGSMSDDDVTTDWIRNIREIRHAFDSTFIILHHDGKDLYHEGKVVDKGNSNIFGSIFWSSFINANYKFKLLPDNNRILELGKERSGKMIDKISLKLIEPKPLHYIATEHIKESTIRIEMLIRGCKDWIHSKEIVNNTKFTRMTVYRALKELQDKLDKKTENGVVYYKYKEIK